MKMNTPEIREIRTTWLKFSGMYKPSGQAYDLFRDFKVVNRNNEYVEIFDFYNAYQSPQAALDSPRIAFKIKKSYWAVGRSMTIESKIEGIPSGEWKITGKAEANSYDMENFLICEYVPISLDTPRKALNWLERQIAALEAEDGVTTDKIVKEMGVR